MAKSNTAGTKDKGKKGDAPAAPPRFQFRSKHRLYGAADVTFHNHAFSTTDAAVAERLRRHPDFGTVFHEIPATADAPAEPSPASDDAGAGEGKGAAEGKGSGEGDPAKGTTPPAK